MKNANPVFHAAGRSPVGPLASWRRIFAGSRVRFVVLAVLIVAPGAGLPGCGKPGSAVAAGGANSAPPKTLAHFFPIKVGDKTVRMQFAVRSDEMQRGLMERRDLARDDGMIFVYEHPQQMSFWMRNTPTPLDIGFFNAAGVLQEVYPMYPFDETTVMSHGNQLQFALEMNQNWFRENGVKPGAQLDMKALAAALKERGFELRRFGIPDGK